MASNAWTATRADLVQEVAKARAERDAAVARAQAAAAKLAAYRAGRNRINAQNRDRARAKEVAAAIQQLAAAQRHLEHIPPDPNAELHRRTLIAALKEKP